MNPIHYKDNDGRTFYEYIEKLSDRELQEKQAHYLRNIERLNIRILSNLQFWFYFTIASMAIAILILMSK